MLRPFFMRSLPGWRGKRQDSPAWWNVYRCKPGCAYAKRESHRLELVEKQLGSLLQKKLTEENHRLRFLEQQIKAASPEHLLKRGYSITLKEGKAVTDASCLKEGDKLVTRFAKGEVESIVITDK